MLRVVQGHFCAGPTSTNIGLTRNIRRILVDASVLQMGQIKTSKLYLFTCNISRPSPFSSV